MIRRSRFTILPNIVRCRRDLAKTFSVVILSYRSWTRWLLGYPEAALADTDHALKNARAMDQASTLIYALGHGSFTHIFCGNYAAVNAQLDEAVTLANEKGALAWKAFGMMHQGSLWP